MEVDPAIAKAERAAREKAYAEKVEMEYNLAREHSNCFSFSDVTWLATRLEKPGIKNANGQIEIQPILEGWLKHRYSGRLRSDAVDLTVLEKAMQQAHVNLSNETAISFLQLLQGLSAYQELHLESEYMAGFSENTYRKIHNFFQPYDTTGQGLKARELWAVLGDCGVKMSTMEDQRWMINMVKEMDKDRSGTIDISEFCQILRKVSLRKEAEANSREFKLIGQSRIPVREAEEWVPLFRRNDTDQRNGLSLGQMRQLFDSIGIKWKTDGNEQLKEWMKETDENFNNYLDFGEFCCLIQKMVNEDFQGIRSATSGKRQMEEEFSANDPVKPRWSKECCLSVAWNSGDVEPCSPTLAPRASIDCWSFEHRGSVAALSASDEQTVDALSHALAASRI